MQVHSELDARDALKWVKASPVLPDLILLDCMMPEMSGHEFCVELRKTVPDAVVPVIMISAKTDEENIVSGLSHGCNDFIWSATVTLAQCTPFLAELTCRLLSVLGFVNSAQAARRFCVVLDDICLACKAGTV